MKKFRFAFATDIHMGLPFDGVRPYKGANQRAQWFFKEAAEGRLGDLDFILSGGDMIHGVELEKINAEQPAFAEYMKELSVVFYPCVGNHENRQHEGDAVYEKAYRDTFGADRTQYAFVHKGILFIMLNNSGDTGFDGSIEFQSPEVQQACRAARRKFLEQALAEHPGLPVFITFHIPIVPIRDAAVLEKTFGFISWICGDLALRQLIEDNSDRIIAVLSGHVHLTGRVKTNGVTHIVPSGLASFPHDVAIFDVANDCIDVQMISAPTELAVPYTTNLHLRKKDVAHTDSEHSTDLLYCTGNESERKFSLPYPRQRA
ncbi:MAG: metallophosphoesterase [Kiritimatiellales bacterium]